MATKHFDKHFDNTNLSITDLVSFWHKNEQMHGIVRQVRRDAAIVEAWPISSPSTRREHLVEMFRLKPREVKPSIPEESKPIEGFLSLSITFTMPIGDKMRKFRIKTNSPGKTIREAEKVLSNVEVSLPYKNAAGVNTYLISTFGRIIEKAQEWNIVILKRNVTSLSSEIKITEVL